MEQSAWAIFDALIPILLIIAAGWTFRSRGWLKDHADEPLMMLTVNLFFPALVFHSMLNNELLADIGFVAVTAGIGFGLIVVASLLSLAVGRLIGFREGDGLRTFGLAGGIQNYGYFAIPLVATLFTPEEARESLGVLFTHNVGVDLAMWSVGIAILSGNFRSLTMAFKKGPVVAVLICLGLIWTGLDRWVPPVLLKVASTVGACAVPTGVFLVGMSLSALWGKDPIRPRVVIGGILVRNLLMPMVFFACLAWIPMQEPLKRVLLIQSAMPAAIFPVVIARFYSGKPEVAAQVAISTTIASLVTLPVLVLLGLNWFL